LTAPFHIGVPVSPVAGTRVALKQGNTLVLPHLNRLDVLALVEHHMLKSVVADTVVCLREFGLEMCHFGFRILARPIAINLRMEMASSRI
jgi:hypothetical protein